MLHAASMATDMRTVTLIRQHPLKTATMGIIKAGDLELYTIERPWLDNQNFVSCIPTGIYECRYTLSPRMKKYTYEVLNVPKRAGIRIHGANYAEQLFGCISLGEKFGFMQGKPAVMLSRSAITKFELEMGKKPFKLEVM